MASSRDATLWNGHRRSLPGKVGKRGEPNRWVTFYAYLARKHGGRFFPLGHF
jgi:hypothetical protein